jgi:D-galactarolactone cycloisomerase
MARIREVLAHPVSVPLERTLWTAHEALASSSVVLVEVRTEEGATGIGQIHGSPQKAIVEWVVRLGELARGMDPCARVAIWEKLFSLTSPRPGGVFARDGLPPALARGERARILAAIGGIDLALWDLAGKLAGMPVWRLLGGEGAPVFAYATGGYYREGAGPADYAEELAGFVAKGYRAVKLKCGGLTLADEIARVRAVREAIGPETLLMLDLNAAYALDEAIAFARAVEPFGVFWLEEPLHWYLQPADFARLARATPIPLAHGERELTRHTVRDFVASGAIRYVQFDATRAAGFTEALRVAHLAEQHGVRIAPHLAPEIHGHLVAAFPGAAFGVETHGGPERDPLWFGLFAERAEVREGRLHLTGRPGFGIEVDWKFVERYRA